MSRWLDRRTGSCRSALRTRGDAVRGNALIPSTLPVMRGMPIWGPERQTATMTAPCIARREIDSSSIAVVACNSRSCHVGWRSALEVHHHQEDCLDPARQPLGRAHQRSAAASRRATPLVAHLARGAPAFGASSTPAFGATASSAPALGASLFQGSTSTFVSTPLPLLSQQKPSQLYSQHVPETTEECPPSPHDGGACSLRLLLHMLPITSKQDGAQLRGLILVTGAAAHTGWRWLALGKPTRQQPWLRPGIGFLLASSSSSTSLSTTPWSQGTTSRLSEAQHGMRFSRRARITFWRLSACLSPPTSMELQCIAPLMHPDN